MADDLTGSVALPEVSSAIFNLRSSGSMGQTHPHPHLAVRCQSPFLFFLVLAFTIASQRFGFGVRPYQTEGVNVFGT